MNEDELYQRLGRNIASRRRALRLTQADVADKVELSRASLANIERGKQKVLLHHLYRIADTLGVSEVQQLLPAGRLTLEPKQTELANSISGASDLTASQREQVNFWIARSSVRRTGSK